ncbi:hypothetical protein J3A84_09505 [Proteiniclasticum sp. SCR006]|uniref:Uncharacterized protein n=1 Tax=Proteiniclasticum aestuarii TaxID=2817862 RepID=A0A939HB89_9CLOT|nr:hypothetical protein [Proteiniclasticum aestuarii]MBO1265263.1 hypothetical protein [Proteiniclasticum aestuarii]
MEKTKLTGQYYSDENKIVFNFEEGQSLELNTENDIDFTDLVKQLTFLIETEKEIDISLDEPEDPKLKIIYETITEIIETYNLNLKDFMTAQDVDKDED